MLLATYVLAAEAASITSNYGEAREDSETGFGRARSTKALGSKQACCRALINDVGIGLWPKARGFTEPGSAEPFGREGWGA